MSRKRRRDLPQAPPPSPHFAIVDGELQPPLPVQEARRIGTRYKPACPMCVKWRRLAGRGDDTVDITRSSHDARWLKCGFCGYTWAITLTRGRHALDEQP